MSNRRKAKPTRADLAQEVKDEGGFFVCDENGVQRWRIREAELMIDMREPRSRVSTKELRLIRLAIDGDF